ncbi:MAG: hypothetical protein ACFFAE_16915, partial [Candidatus Hodarchaeota archaeon]
VDNLLVGVNTSALKIIQRLYTEEFEFLDVKAFRGISSQYRSRQGIIPLIEKANFASGFLFPARNFLHKKTPKEMLERQQISKIIAQRIISYRTIPKFFLDVRTWVDQEGLILTHETVINIIPNYPQEILSLAAVAGLLESSFIEWWLRHAVYTKEFVTSKDFDRAYINSIRIPQISGSKNRYYREKLLELLLTKKYKEIMIQLKAQTNIDKFYTLGEIYSRFQRLGEKLKSQITQIMDDDKFPLLDQKKTDFQNLRNFYRLLIQEKNSSLTNLQEFEQFKGIMRKYKEIRKLKEYMDDIIISIFQITPREQKIIK